MTFLFFLVAGYWQLEISVAFEGKPYYVVSTISNDKLLAFKCLYRLDVSLKQQQVYNECIAVYSSFQWGVNFVQLSAQNAKIVGVMKRRGVSAWP